MATPPPAKAAPSATDPQASTVQDQEAAAQQASADVSLAEGTGTGQGTVQPASGGQAESSGGETATAPSAPPDVEWAQPSDYQPKADLQTDADQFITSPSLYPDQPVTSGTNTTPVGTVDVPDDVANWLPTFAEAAALPDAPPQLRSLVTLLNYHLGKS